MIDEIEDTDDDSADDCTNGYATMPLADLRNKLRWFSGKARQLRQIIKGREAIADADAGRVKLPRQRRS